MVSVVLLETVALVHVAVLVALKVVGVTVVLVWLVGLVVVSVVLVVIVTLVHVVVLVALELVDVAETLV